MSKKDTDRKTTWRETACVVMLVIAAVVVGDFVLEIAQHSGANVWVARGLGAVAAGIAGWIATPLFRRCLNPGDQK